MCDYIFDTYVIIYVYVNGLHHAQAPTYDCTVVSIYNMTLTTQRNVSYTHMEHYTISGSGVAIYAFR